MNADLTNEEAALDRGIAEKPTSGNSSSSPISTSSHYHGLLPLTDIALRLDVHYSRLRRLAEAPGVGEIVGARSVPGAKGVRYEPRSVETFRRLVQASNENVVTPATAAGWLRAQEDFAVTEPLLPADAEMIEVRAIAEQRRIAEKPTSDNSAGPANIGGLMTLLAPLAALPAALRELAASIHAPRPLQPTPQVPPTPDRLLTAEQAAELLACHPRSVSRYVTPVRHRTWKESDVQRYIAGLGSAGLGAAESETAK